MSDINNMADSDEAGNVVKRQTIYMPFAVHDQLRELAFIERTSQQELIREAMDMLFEARGRRSWSDLKAEPKPSVETR